MSAATVGVVLYRVSPQQSLWGIGSYGCGCKSGEERARECLYGALIVSRYRDRLSGRNLSSSESVVDVAGGIHAVGPSLRFPIQQAAVFEIGHCLTDFASRKVRTVLDLRLH